MTLAEPDMTNPRGLFEIAQYIHAKGDFDESIPIFQELLKLAENLEDLDFTWNILTNLAVALDNCGYHDEAIYYYKEAISIDRQRNDRKSEVTHLIKIGEIYVYQGDLVTGSEYAKIALSFLKDGIEKDLSEKEQIEIYFSNFLETLNFKMRSQKLIEIFVELLE